MTSYPERQIIRSLPAGLPDHHPPPPRPARHDWKYHLAIRGRASENSLTLPLITLAWFRPRSHQSFSDSRRLSDPPGVTFLVDEHQKTVECIHPVFKHGLICLLSPRAAHLI